MHRPYARTLRRFAPVGRIDARGGVRLSGVIVCCIDPLNPPSYCGRWLPDDCFKMVRSRTDAEVGYPGPGSLPTSTVVL
jgi:hypothetical protein